MELGAKGLLKWAEEKTNTPIRIMDVVRWGQDEGIENAAEINDQIQSFLMMYTESTPQVTVSMCGENGAEAWIMLQGTYNGRTVGDHMEVRRRVDNPPIGVNDEKLMVEIERWEEQVAKLYQKFSETTSESQNLLALTKMCSRQTSEVVCISDDSNSYDDIKRKLHGYLIRKRESKPTGNNNGGVNGIDELGNEEEGWWSSQEWEGGDVDGLTWGKGGKKRKRKEQRQRKRGK